MNILRSFTITGTSPAAAGQAVLGGVLGGMSKYDYLMLDLAALGGTGGTLDLVVQRKLATDVWFDWVRFPNIAAGATKYYTAVASTATTIVEVGKGADAGTGTIVLAANTNIGGFPTDSIRLLAVANGATSAGAVQTLYVSAYLLNT